MTDKDEAIAAALIHLAEHGVPADIQEALVYGSATFGIRPGSLAAALFAGNRRQHQPEPGPARPAAVEGHDMSEAKTMDKTAASAASVAAEYAEAHVDMRADAADDLDVAITSFENRVKAEGGYLPAIATLLRIKADELADRYPDDSNGGRTTSEGSDNG